MKIALIGASGFVGSAILNEALQRGHEVIALARHTENIKREDPQLKKIKVDVFNQEELAQSIKKADAVVSAYNAGWTNPNLYEDFLKGAKAVQEGVKRSGVKRFLFVGGAGSLFIAPGQQLVDTPQFPAEWKPGALAARDYLNLLKNEKELEWTFLSPAVEMHQGTSGNKKGQYRTGLENPVFDPNGRSVISVEDLAAAIVDELEQPRHIGKRFTVAY
ncbi:MAG: NAD(P)-dependent oxidoreductase [Flavisolibacter sp.]